MFEKFKLRACLCAGLTAAMLAVSVAEAAPQAIGGFFKQIRQQSFMDKDEQGEHEVLYQRFAGLAVDKELRERFPKLSAAIEQRTSADWARMQKDSVGMKAEAVQFRRESPIIIIPLLRIWMLSCAGRMMLWSVIWKWNTRMAPVRMVCTAGRA